MRFRFSAELFPPIRTVPTDGPFYYSRQTPASGVTAIEISADGTTISSSASVECSRALVLLLETGAPSRGDADELDDELVDRLQIIHQPIGDLLRLVAQELHDIEELRERRNSRLEWSLDGGAWTVIRRGRLSGVIRGFPLYPLEGSSSTGIATRFAAGERSLAAFEYIREARRTTDDRIAWIAATIAAEIGIKEILGRVAPQLLPLLLEMPAPPLHKLYGKILNAMSGQPSTFVREIQRGAEIRNHLVHKPASVDLDSQGVSDYISDVEAALYELLNMSRESGSSGV